MRRIALALAILASPAHAFDTELSVRCEPATHRIEGRATLAIEEASSTVLLRRTLRVIEATLDGHPLTLAPQPGDGALARYRVEAHGGRSKLAIHYEGEIFEPPTVAHFSRERVADQTEGTIQAEGIFLAPDAGWYPRLESSDLAAYRLEVRLPAGWEGASEGTRVVGPEDPAGSVAVYESERAVEGLHLVAGPWKRTERDHRGTKIACLFYPEESDLVDGYLDAVARYLDLYGAWLGPHAYDRFDVVENFFSTGYGMPGFTVLGKDVLRLPFIVGTSLGHEVAHDWWGNGVLVDESGGNWSEGLTTYVADYHYRSEQGADAAAEYRREVCRDYSNYVAEDGQDLALTAFRERSTPATRAVGYGKTMMIFHMLERRLGKPKVDAAMRRVYRDSVGKRASWATWRRAFALEAGESLDWFFDQWVGRTGAPRIELRGVALREGTGDDPFVVTGAIVQQGSPYRLSVPVRVESGKDSVTEVVECKGTETPFEIPLGFRPAVLRADPEQDVFRRLDPLEMPPVLSRVLGDPKALFVVADRPGYRELAATLTRTGEGEVVEASAATPERLAHRNVFLLGAPVKNGPLTHLLDELPEEVALGAAGFAVEGKRFEEPGAALLVVGRHPSDPTRAVALFDGRSQAAIEAAGRKLVHYGKYSFLAFVDGTNRAKGVARVTTGPLVHVFEAPAVSSR